MPDATRSGKRWIDVGNSADAEAVSILGGVGTQPGASVSLLASAARTTSAAGTDVTDQTLKDARALQFVLDVTAQAGTTPTLDVAIQAKIGTTYFNLARFSQTAAATGQKLVKVNRFLAAANEEAPAADPAVGTGLLIRDQEWRDTLRVKWTIGGTTPSYTFSVAAYPIK